MNSPRYALVHEPYQVIIRDVVNQLNLFFMAESGHGPRTSDIKRAERVVKYLNDHESETQAL